MICVLVDNSSRGNLDLESNNGEESFRTSVPCQHISVKKGTESTAHALKSVVLQFHVIHTMSSHIANPKTSMLISR